MRNFRGEIGRKIRYKMLSFKRIGFHFKMTNENVRFFAIFIFTDLYFLLITTYITKKQLKPYRKVTVFNHSPSLHTSPLK